MKGDNGSGVAAVVLGITGIVLSSLGGVILGIVGLIFALKQRKSAQNKWAKAGLILNIISIILGLIIFLAKWYFFGRMIGYSSLIQAEGVIS